MHNAAPVAEIEALLLRGAHARAGEALRSLRWSIPQSLPLQRLNALLMLLTGEPAKALADFERLASNGNRENVYWYMAATALRDKPGIDATAFMSQLGVERLRSSPYLDYPLEVHIETLATCNAACSYCPYPKLERKGAEMSGALFEKIVGDLEGIPKDLNFSVAPFKVNEPLLDKRIWTMCAYINQRLPNARLRLFSNGSTLNDTNIGRLARIRNLQHLWISLNEHEAGAYRELMHLPLAKTLERLDRLHDAVAAGDFPHPVIVSRVCDRTQRDHEFAAFVQQNYPRFSLAMMPYATWAGQVDDRDDTPVPPTGCARWFELSIMATGKVALCCMDGEGKHIIGDASTENVLDIYNKPEYRKLRDAAPTRLEAGAPCSGCST